MFPTFSTLFTFRPFTSREVRDSCEPTSEMSPYQRAKFNSITFHKENSATRLGMYLGEDEDGCVIIKSIRPDGFMCKSPLGVGDKLIFINRNKCQSMSKASIVKLIRRIKGTCTIVTSNEDGDPSHVESMVEKPDIDSPIGITTKKMGPNKEESLLQISFVSPMGLFAHSLLATGDEVLQINRQSCNHPTIAQEMFWDAPRFISIRACTATVPDEDKTTTTTTTSSLEESSDAVKENRKTVASMPIKHVEITTFHGRNRPARNEFAVTKLSI